MNTEYISDLRSLSLNARSAVALLVCEKYFEIRSIYCEETAEFLDHLWDWPIVTDFDAWEKSRPVLVNYGLGDGITKSMAKTLSLVSVDEPIFRNVVSSTIEILWGSFWGAAEDDASYQSLMSVLQSSGLKQFPVLTPFRYSMFKDGDGWGHPVSMQDRDFWRQCSMFT